MKISGRLSIQSAGAPRLYLFRAGLFYHVYNQGACWFCTLVKPPKIHLHHLAGNVSRYCYGGFPFARLGHYLPPHILATRKDFEGYITIDVPHYPTGAFCQTWLQRFCNG